MSRMLVRLAGRMVRRGEPTSDLCPRPVVYRHHRQDGGSRTGVTGRREAAGLERNAVVVPGNVGTTEDVDVLTRVCAEEPDSMVREHAAWALDAIRARGSTRRGATV